MRRFLLLVPVLLASLPAVARDLKVATWNLGWHMSTGEAAEWIRDCSAPFALNPATKLWEPSTKGPSKPGWELDWGRDAPIKWDIAAKPPCNIYQAGGKVVPVTIAAYDRRMEQISNFIAKHLGADIIAFQEVSGEQAVREVLPGFGNGYLICTFQGYKVQRLVIAYRIAFGKEIDCVVDNALSLPSEPAENRVRPGLSATLAIDGRMLRVMTVHLKSSCVSPLETGGPPARGRLDGPDAACMLLQKQVVPLESWLEARGSGSTILLGDFNRNLAHEQVAFPTAQVRTDGSDPKAALPLGARVRSLIGEINDGAPQATLELLDVQCPVNKVASELCRRAKTVALSRDEQRPLTRADSLGCRNPIGLDHVLVSPDLAKDAAAEKVPLGRLGGTRPASPSNADPLLALSDHCPVMAKVRF